MSTVFNIGQQLSQDDLNIFLRDCDGNLVDPTEIYFTIYDKTTGVPVLVGDLYQCATRVSVGFYYADISIEYTENLGEYEIHWSFKLTDDSSFELVKQRFAVINPIEPKEFIANSGSIVYSPGQILTDKDLFINVKNRQGHLIDPAEISYAIYDKSSGLEILQSGAKMNPMRSSAGSYYANFQVPLDAQTGDWVVRWSIRENSECAESFACQPFAVVCPGTNVGSLYSDDEKDMIKRLRYILRDNNPDRNYRFAPPNPEESIQNYTQVFGYVWQDEELLFYISDAIDWINGQPPFEDYTTATLPNFLRPVMLTWAAYRALMALSINAAHEIFDYSIAGISLDLNARFGNYRDAADGFKDAAQEQLQNYKDYGIRIVRGIQQPKFGIGISSALGPYSGSSTLSRRNWISSSFK